MLETDLKIAMNIYDIMAIAYVYICNDKDFNLNFAYDENAEHKFDIILSKYIEDKITQPLKAFSKLKAELISLLKLQQFTTIEQYYLLIGLDSCEIYEYKCSTYLDKTFKSYVCLNNLYTKEVKIYPKLLQNYRENIESIYKKEYNNNYLRDRKIHDNLSINAKLENYIFYYNKEYNIIIHELIDYENFINELNCKKEISIALLPITSINIHKILNIDYSKDKKFEIKDIPKNYENFICQRCMDFIDSLENNIDFLVFPEMLMTPGIIQSIEEKLKNTDIKFAFCGSIWNNNNNICHVLYEGEEIFQYYKKIPFDIKYTKEELLNIISNSKNNEQISILNYFLEHHNFKDKITFQERLIQNCDVHVIDINHFGRIFTYICKDIDDDHYMKVLKILQSDFIFMPACNPSNDLINNAVTIAERYHCITTMCNTCSALCNDEDSLNNKIINKANIGFIVSPSKDDTQRSHKKTYYSFNDDCKNCESNCNGRVFHIKLDGLKLENKTVSLNIK